MEGKAFQKVPDQFFDTEAAKALIDKKAVSEDFFLLSTGMAGEDQCRIFSAGNAGSRKGRDVCGEESWRWERIPPGRDCGRYPLL